LQGDWSSDVCSSDLLMTLWIRSSVPESAMWQEHHRLSQTRLAQESTRVVEAQQKYEDDSFARIFRPPYVKNTFALLFLNFFGMFAWWGLFTWIPPYLSLPVEYGGRCFGVMGTTTLLLVLNLVGMFPGYASFGWFADRIGRRKAFIAFLVMAAVLVPVYAIARDP